MMTPPGLRLLGIVTLGLLLLAPGVVAPPPAAAQLNVTGQWTTLPYQAPINPIHVALLHNGKVLIVAGSENNQNNTVYKNAVWDPATGTFAQQTTPWDLFCNGMSFLPDGRVIITGGNIQYDPFYGPPWTTIFDPATEQFYRVEDMAAGRWYPTTQPLNDGGTMVFGGLDGQGNTNTTVEIYDVGGGWTPPYPSNFTPGWYPRLHLLPNGKVFMSGPFSPSKTFDPSAGTWWTGGIPTNYGGSRLYGSSVLLPLHPDDGYRPRVMIFGGNTQTATNTVEYVDLGAWPEQWVTMPSMSVPRVTMNAVLMPTGKILTLGGSTKFNDPATAHKIAETFDPVAQTWTPSGTAAYDRLYHSSALLLPDATVWVAGSNPTRFIWEPHMEIYKPPYLFTSSGALAPRPTISSAPSKVGYGQSFSVGTAQAAGISKVMLMRPGSNTHAFDSEQRLIYTNFTKGSGTLTVTAPASQGAAPPGWYMLFLLDSAGVPSVAKFIQLVPHPTNQPPTATITNPTTPSVTISPGQSVTFASSASDPDGSIALYSWIFPGGSPAKSSAQNPGAVTFATPGVYTVSLTVLDNLGVNNPSPPTVTVNVTDGALGASITSPTNGATVSGTVTVSMAATNIQGSPTQFLLTLDNATTLSNQSVSSGTTASYAWDSTTVGNGNHTLDLTVTDGAGRTATASIGISVSNGGGGGGGGSGPTVDIVSPAGNVWIGNSIRITATASSGGAPLTALKIYGNGGVALQVTCPASPCTLDNWWVTGSLPDAAYEIHAVATDSGGASTTSTPRILYKNTTTPVVPSGAPPTTPGTDTTPPAVAMSAPSEGSTLSGTVTVSATATDDVGVAGVQFKLDGVNLGAEDTTAPYSVPWDTTTAPNGSHTLTAVARDAAGNVTTSAPISVMVSNTGGGDTTPPTVAISAPAGGSTVSGSTTVSATATDNVGVVGVQFKLDGVNLGAEDTTAPYSVAWDTSTATAGSHTLTAVARDAAGNTTTSAPVTVTVGGSSGPAPTVTITAPPNNAWTGNSIRVTVTASSTGAALASIKVYGNGGIALQQTCSGTSCTLDNWWLTGPLPNGAYEIQAVATDTTGACAVTPPVKINKNATTPVTPSGAPSCGGGGGSDTTAPTISLSAPAAGATVSGTTTVSATASDNVGVVGVQFKLDGANLGAEDTTSPHSIAWDTTTATNGTHTLTAVARDAAGNTATSAPISVTVSNTPPPDSTPPTVTITEPAGGATVSSTVTVSATASDDVGVVGVQFKLDGVNLGAEDTTAPYTLAWDTTTATSGSHTLTAVARDAAGNTTTSAPVTVTVSNGGPAPTISITTPPNGAWIGNSVRIVATASSSGPALASIKVWGNGGVVLQTACTGTACTIDNWWVTGSLPNAAYEIQAVATDANGASTISAPVVVNKNATSPVIPSGAGTGSGGDTTPPTVSVTAPSAGSTVSGGVTVTASASDNVGVVGVQFKLDGVNLGAEDAGSPYTVVWDTTMATNGDHTLTAVARDAAGNTTTSAPITVTVSNGAGGGTDTTPPSVTITQPFNGDWTGNSIRVVATATDNVGLATLKLYGDGVQFGSTVVCGGATSCTFDDWWLTGSLPPGQHTIVAVATDTTGNQTSSAPVTINK